MKLKFNIPRTEDPAVCSTHQPRYVRVVPEATWRRIVAVLNADTYRDHWPAVQALREHLEKRK